ncbi:CDC9 ATP-dependent DNA ligase [uncultured Caudovirales phage]|uniref:DNA ligase n=1 Tax=uncultured Caudovirales phage TaxID=2100421 RepID=A0A6J5KVH8_9CAUD|nr:CDC9 ATP-dependent DNA ligase [uncultured Caudovirales phage]CAB5208855.1 CDC9 ATP-dependent DNA ligase [uncultured Caudovirales phage]
MRQPWEVISLLEADNSRLAKEAIILEEAKADNGVFFNGCRLALDAMITFGIKQVKEKTDEDGPGLSWDNFDNVASLFRTRKLTGNSARDAIDELISQATKEQWNSWYRRILIKDMRAGFSEKTVNNVVKKTYENYSIPVFSCQLAHDSANHESKVCGKKYIEVKLDGVRVITIVYPDGRVDLFSRNGKELANFPHIQEQISAVVKKSPPPYALVLDGEVMSSSFQDLMKQVHRKSDVQSNDAVLNLFDVISLSEFEAGASTERQEDRSAKVYYWHKENKDALPNVSVVGHELVDLDSEEGQKRYKEINAQAIAGGYEGIMLKDPDAGYECKRSVAWLKLKPFIEVTLEVKKVEEGTGKNLGRLGAFVCEGTDDGKFITVNVGSGLTDDMRNSFWADSDSLIGQLVEVRADAITQNQDGTYSLRFPRFKGFRGFEPGEKI